VNFAEKSGRQNPGKSQRRHVETDAKSPEQFPKGRDDFDFGHLAMLTLSATRYGSTGELLIEGLPVGRGLGLFASNFEQLATSTSQ
jgi:hypothetical protein